MGYRLTGEAQRDLQQIRDYTLRNWGAAQSRSYLERLQALLTKLGEMPGLGQSRAEELDHGIYSFPYVSHTIYYRLQKTDILVMAVLHQSRLPAIHLVIKP